MIWLKRFFLKIIILSIKRDIRRARQKMKSIRLGLFTQNLGREYARAASKLFYAINELEYAESLLKELDHVR